MSDQIIRPTLASITYRSHKPGGRCLKNNRPRRGGSTEEDLASCAAKVYLATISAFEQKGYMVGLHSDGLMIIQPKITKAHPISDSVILPVTTSGLEGSTSAA